MDDSSSSYYWKAFSGFLRCGLVDADTCDASYNIWVKRSHPNPLKASQGKTVTVMEKRENRPRRELAVLFFEAVKDYVPYQFVGLVMDAVIKGYTKDLSWGQIFFSSDYSEVFTLEPMEQTQSNYYAQATVRILVFVVMRHAVYEVDGEESSPHDPKYVFEQWFFNADGGDVTSQSWKDGFTQYGVRTVIKYYLKLYKEVQMKRDAARNDESDELPSVLLKGVISSSDNCAEQYKCLHSFLGISRLISIIKEEFSQRSEDGSPKDEIGSQIVLDDFEIIWLWAGAGFFKWRHDGAGGWFKMECRKEVLKLDNGFFKGVIGGAKDMVVFGNKKFKNPVSKFNKIQTLSPEQLVTYNNRVQQNHFELVTSSALQAEDVEKGTVTVTGTRNIHFQHVHGPNSGKAMFMNLMCPCVHHRHFGEKGGQCEYPHLFPSLLPRNTQLDQAPLAVEQADQNEVERESDDEDNFDDDNHVVLVLEAGQNVAIQDHDNGHERGGYMLIKLFDQFVVTVPKNKTIVCDMVVDENLTPLTFTQGEELLVGYLWSIVDPRKRTFELFDDQTDIPDDERWSGYPKVYFPKAMVLHDGFNMPAYSPGRESDDSRKIVQLSKEDEKLILGEILDGDYDFY